MSRPIDTPAMPGMRRYYISDSGIQHFEGKMLTQLEASITDTEQRKALKGIFRQMLWEWVVSWDDNPENQNKPETSK